MANNRLQGETQQFRVLKQIPLVITWTAGTPAVTFNPENESVTLTDNGAGDVTITLASASLAPIMVMGHMLHVADANSASLECNLDGATTTTVVKVVINNGGDGITETDPVGLHLLLGKLVAA